MWYTITSIVCILLIWNENKKRNAIITKYLILSFIFPPVGYGLWKAEMPLINDEKRYGGKGWNLMKWIAIIHTIMCIIWAFYGIFIGAEVANSSSSDAYKAGAVIGTGLSIMMIIIIWFFGVVGSLVLGLIIKKPITEVSAALNTNNTESFELKQQNEYIRSQQFQTEQNINIKSQSVSNIDSRYINDSQDKGKQNEYLKNQQFQSEEWVNNESEKTPNLDRSNLNKHQDKNEDYIDLSLILLFSVILIAVPVVVYLLSK